MIKGFACFTTWQNKDLKMVREICFEVLSCAAQTLTSVNTKSLSAFAVYQQMPPQLQLEIDAQEQLHIDAILLLLVHA